MYDDNDYRANKANTQAGHFTPKPDTFKESGTGVRIAETALNITKVATIASVKIACRTLGFFCTTVLEALDKPKSGDSK